MLFLEILSWIITVIALTGAILNAKQNKWGFILWIISNSYLCILNHINHQYAQSVLFLAYLIITVSGFITWCKNERKY